MSPQTIQQLGGWTRMLLAIIIGPLLAHFIDNKLVAIILDVSGVVIICVWSVWAKQQTIGGILPIIGGVLRNAVTNLFAFFVAMGWMNNEQAQQALLALFGLTAFFWAYESKKLPSLQLKPRATTKRIF